MPASPLASTCCTSCITASGSLCLWFETHEERVILCFPELFFGWMFMRDRSEIRGGGVVRVHARMLPLHQFSGTLGKLRHYYSNGGFSRSPAH